MIDELIDRILAAKSGDKEFILSMDCQGQWFAAIGNKSEHVCIGEQLAYGEDGADFYAEGPSASGALDALLSKMAVTATP
jgi:hypothetical protein